MPVAQPFPVEQVVVGAATLTVWVADTPDNRQQGLMWVESLPDGIDGMLFVFEETARVSFWMLNTLMPLDIWWFDGDGVLLGTTRMEPCESQPCRDYPSPGPVRYTIETPAGVFDFETGLLLGR